MFVLVQNNSVILGPNDWNKRKFERILEEELEITADLPVNLDSFLEISETVKIYPVEFSANPDINPRTEILHGPFWNFDNNIAVASYVPLTKSVESIKNEMIGQLADKRWKKETGGVIVTLQNINIWITTQRGERDIFLQAVQLNKNNAVWKLVQVEENSERYNTVWLTLSIQELQQIVAAIATNVQDSFNWESEIAAQINLATTVEELDAIVI